MGENKYEYDVVTSEDYFGLMSQKKESGWEVYKTDTKTKEEKSLLSKTTKVIKVYHLRRNITPTKIKINTTVEVPRYVIDQKRVDWWRFTKLGNDYLKKKGLLK